jgi:hypothetical protein
MSEIQVCVPLRLLELLASAADDYVRVLLCFHLAEHRAGVLGKPAIGIAVPLGELAEGAGLSRGRALTALETLSAGEKPKVKELPDGTWRRL